jgi:hypothetical protein
MERDLKKASALPGGVKEETQARHARVRDGRRPGVAGQDTMPTPMTLLLPRLVPRAR